MYRIRYPAGRNAILYILLSRQKRNAETRNYPFCHPEQSEGSLFRAPGRVHLLGGASPLQARQWELLAEGKGVHREVESEGSLRQSAGPTNRNRIGGARVG